MSEAEKIIRAVKRYSRSVSVQVLTDAASGMVRIHPPFQRPFDVRTIAEWETAVKEGKVALPDSECAY